MGARTEHSVSQQVALITGVGRAVGIGAGIARQLASDGWSLVLSSWAPYDEKMPRCDRPSGLESLVEELNDAGAQVINLPADFNQPDAPPKLFKAIAASGMSLSALVLSHCESVNTDILSTDVESFDRHFAVNARASWQLIREFALQVPASGGRILALTSDATIGNIPYGASKAGLDRIVLSAARELAHLNILANVINPGPIDTGWMDEAMRSACISRQPTGRLGTPADIGNVVAFLLSEKGNWINGQLLKVDGGFSA